MIEKYIKNTKQHYNIKLLDIYELKRDADVKKYNKKMDNKFLLWHGSRIGNVIYFSIIVYIVCGHIVIRSKNNSRRWWTVW